MVASCSLKKFYIRKTAAGLDNAHHKEQHQQSAADGLKGTVDALNDCPNPTALELLRRDAEELPDLHQFPIPGSQGRVEVVHDPVSASYFYHLLDFLKNAWGWLFQPSPCGFAIDVLRLQRGAYLRPSFQDIPESI